MENMLNVSSSPHDRASDSTRQIMRDVIIALIPAAAFGVYRFGFRAFLVLMVSVTSCVLSEYLYCRFMKLPKHPFEASCVVTGLLLGMNLPSTVPLWIPIVGALFAIIVVKMFYGGLGHNFMNPALAARCFLSICFAKIMTDMAVESGSNAFIYGQSAIDGVSSATPLSLIKAGENVSLFDEFFGLTGGVIGETCTLALLIGGIYLLFRKVITLHIPLAYMLTFAVFILIFGSHGFDMEYVLEEICGGGLMLGAIFMATDYVTSPVTKTGKIVYGIFLGILTGIFRLYGNSSEGVSFAIIFGNLLVPLIEKFTMPHAFGVGKRAYKKTANN